MITHLHIASNNKGKQNEFGVILSPHGIALSFPDAAIPEPEETEDTFEKNAILKARYYGNLAGIPALADDSGLEVPALGGMPGVKSARWLKSFPTPQDAWSSMAADLAGKSHAARLICALSLYDPIGKTVVTVQGICNGTLVFPPQGPQRFGFDPIFIMDGQTKTFAELGTVEKNKISPRSKALRTLLDMRPDILYAI